MGPYRRARKDYPDGVVAIYDSGGKTADRYMVVFDPVECSHWPGMVYPNLTMSGVPYHPQGVCMHGETAGWRPTGGWGTDQKVIAFEDLPADCQRAVRQDLDA